MKLAILVTLSLLFSSALCYYSISDFEGPPFSVKPASGTPNLLNPYLTLNLGMYNLGGLGFDNVTAGNQVVAYGDFNNDK
jgi:hypothetical protein